MTYTYSDRKDHHGKNAHSTIPTDIYAHMIYPHTENSNANKNPHVKDPHHRKSSHENFPLQQTLQK